MHAAAAVTYILSATETCTFSVWCSIYYLQNLFLEADWHELKLWLVKVNRVMVFGYERANIKLSNLILSKSRHR